MTATLENWLERLGYSENPDALFTARHLPEDGAYAPEIEALLTNEDVGASAVFTIEGMPTVCFVEAKTDSNSHHLIQTIQRKIWNQSLISLILVIDDEFVQPIPASRQGSAVNRITLKDASPDGHFSVLDVISGDIEQRLPDWFADESRVDRKLLKNLSLTVDQLEKCGMEKQGAQYVLARCLFISFLEHRGIVGIEYRARRHVEQLHELVKVRDRVGTAKLLAQLKNDFNGDFLQPDDAVPFDWSGFDDTTFDCLSDFLGMVDIENGQQSFWAYDFRYIPVELISGIYETFLNLSEKKLSGAYYTPRHLANFAVDQAFADSANICEEIVYDGACGSGILLATSYRRMLRAAEKHQGSTLCFRDRCKLLLEHIRGSDIDETACRVTAFSLYLCLLENLDPVDIALLQDDEQVKLPHLLNHILLFGAEEGDFFSEKNRFAEPGSCTIYLSNPPWAEPSGNTKDLPFELWSKSLKKVLSYRQIAMAFAHKAPMTLREGGRFCLILNAKPFLSRSSQGFLQQWLADIRLRRLINFSDIRRMLFPAAIHPCIVAMGGCRLPDSRISAAEDFEYWVPKSDISLAFGRLTVHGIDRNVLQTTMILRDNQPLRSFFWGGAHDHALIARLRLGGTVKDLLTAEDDETPPRWLDGKGFHHIDQKRIPQDPDWLKNIPFYNAKSKPSYPLLDPQLLESFPDKFDGVASFGAHNGQLFVGPRVIFNDGASGTFEPQAFYAEKSFSFQSSVGAVKGENADASLLKFFTAYLRSKLAKYLLLHTSYSLAIERTRVTMKEVGTLPFYAPETHSNPEFARRTIEQVATAIDKISQSDALIQPRIFEEMRADFDELIFDYFELSDIERILIDEVVSVIIPSVQPTHVDAINNPTLTRTQEYQVKRFAKTLQDELRCIRTRLGGQGNVSVEALIQSLNKIGPIGIVRIALTEDADLPTFCIQDQTVTQALSWLREQKVLPMPAGESFNLASDFLFFANNAIYLAKPLVNRFWLSSQALQDAHRVLSAIRSVAPAPENI